MIEDIRIENVNIRDIRIPVYGIDAGTVLDGVPVPVTVEAGVPIVDIPGCVEAHEANNKSNVVGVDDPKGLVTYCDAGVPSFDPIDYDKDNLEFTKEEPVPVVRPPAPPSTERPKPQKAPLKIDCPSRQQEIQFPVGKVLEGNERVTGYELVNNQCLVVTETLSIPDQIIFNAPNPGKVTSTASIAVIATTSALLAKPLADILLKVVKPTVKKVMKKIAKIRGKTLPVQSLRDRRAEQHLRNHAIRKLKGKE